MPNSHNIEIVDQLTKKFNSSKGIYLTCYTGLNVIKKTELRKKFRENGVDYFVSKNTLTRIAANNAGYDDKFDNLLKGQVGIAYSSEDPTSPAKVIKDFKKENKNSLEVLGLIFEGEVYGAEKYKELADLPSKEELLAQLIGGIGQPMSKFVGTLNGAMSKLLGILNSLKEKKS